MLAMMEILDTKVGVPAGYSSSLTTWLDIDASEELVHWSLQLGAKIELKRKRKEDQFPAKHCYNRSREYTWADKRCCIICTWWDLIYIRGDGGPK